MIYIDGLVKDYSNSSAFAMAQLLSCIKPSISPFLSGLLDWNSVNRRCSNAIMEHATRQPLLGTSSRSRVPAAHLKTGHQYMKSSSIQSSHELWGLKLCVGHEDGTPIMPIRLAYPILWFAVPSLVRFTLEPRVSISLYMNDWQLGYCISEGRRWKR